MMALGGLGFVLLLLLAFVAFFVVVFGIAFATLKRVVSKREANVLARYPGARRVDRAASFFGQQSRGVAQMRGVGILILTDTALLFQLWVPNQEFRIPLRSIQSLENPSSFLGKSRFTPLLKVIYQ